MTKSKLFKKLIFPISFFLSFSLMITSSIFAGIYTNDGRSDSISRLINEECISFQRGAAIYGDIDMGAYDENFYEKAQNNFNEVLNNYLSLSEHNATISFQGMPFEGITIMNTEFYDEHYNKHHIYGNTYWNVLKDKPESIFISSSLENKLNELIESHKSVGEKLGIDVNNVHLDLEIGGSFNTNFYPSVIGEGCRGDGINYVYNEVIFMNTNMIKKFFPTKLVAMFGQNSTNNGQKYLDLKASCKDKTFDFNFNPKSMTNTHFVENVEKAEFSNVHNNNLLLSVLFFTGVVITFILCLIFMKLSYKNTSIHKILNRKNIIINLSALLLPVLIFVLPIIFLKNKLFYFDENLSVSCINKTSLIIMGICFIIIFGYYLFINKDLIIYLFGEKKDNCEITYEDENK